MDDDDTFLPDQQNRLKAQIKILKERLAKANEKQKRLKRELLEEDISYLVVTKLANTFTDPTITAKRDISNAKQDIFNQMRQAAYVTRREQLNEINKLTEEGYDIKILSENMSKSDVDIKVHTGSRILCVNIKYENKTSAYPTQVNITDERGTIESTDDYEELKERLMYYKLADTLQSILAERTNTEDIMIE
ncbi:hypothetical protein BCV71DRAFT_242363 [Rhizopus microsporus]|uniref:Uncharacterized protein n=1 Tax=Rhizopus microsporus TaxID=58291 RepID=A0A1X0S7W0_RHIZD|nr:hypothetical protein BCV71DRAFT_242363 [Rhizopus microsporus]